MVVVHYLAVLSSLMMLGKGTAAMCEKRNILLKRSITNSDDFSFPEELHAQTETKAFRKDLPGLIQLVFRYDLEEGWRSYSLVPEKFDPANPNSRKFLSTPRELFVIVAELLDTEECTEEWTAELVKWRDTE